MHCATTLQCPTHTCRFVVFFVLSGLFCTDQPTRTSYGCCCFRSRTRTGCGWSSASPATRRYAWCAVWLPNSPRMTGVPTAPRRHQRARSVHTAHVVHHVGAAVGHCAGHHAGNAAGLVVRPAVHGRGGAELQSRGVWTLCQPGACPLRGCWGGEGLTPATPCKGIAVIVLEVLLLKGAGPRGWLVRACVALRPLGNRGLLLAERCGVAQCAGADVVVGVRRGCAPV